MGNERKSKIANNIHWTSFEKKLVKAFCIKLQDHCAKNQ